MAFNSLNKKIKNYSPPNSLNNKKSLKNTTLHSLKNKNSYKAVNTAVYNANMIRETTTRTRVEIESVRLVESGITILSGSSPFLYEIVEI